MSWFESKNREAFESWVDLIRSRLGNPLKSWVDSESMPGMPLEPWVESIQVSGTGYCLSYELIQVSLSRKARESKAQKNVIRSQRMGRKPPKNVNQLNSNVECPKRSYEAGNEYQHWVMSWFESLFWKGIWVMSGVESDLSETELNRIKEWVVPMSDKHSKFQRYPPSCCRDPKRGTSTRTYERMCRCTPPMVCVIRIVTWYSNTKFGHIGRTIPELNTQAQPRNQFWLYATRDICQAGLLKEPIWL